MELKQAKRFLSDLKKMQGSISRVIQDLEEILVDEKPYRKPAPKKKVIPSDGELIERWNKIQQIFKSDENVNQYIAEFVNEKTKAYLSAFIKANALPIEIKDSKEKIGKHLLGLLHVGSTITGS